MKVAFQMDPITDIDINADTTFRIAEEAQKRNHSLFYFSPDRLSYREGQLITKGKWFEVQRLVGDHVSLIDEAEVNINDFDVVWLRQDPPFDMHYITNTHLLDLLEKNTLVVNNPFWVRNFPEKLLVLQFPSLTPPTVITHELEILKLFKDTYKDIIIKPLFGNGGAGVFRLNEGDPNLSSLHELFFKISREPLIAQKYLPEVVYGDKRIILVEGEAVGAINRIPAKGEIRSNMHVGGKPEKTTLNAREKEICQTIGPLLRERGQILVGIDVIGNYLTEINVTSPTGIQELEKFDKVNIAEKIWQAVEKRLD